MKKKFLKPLAIGIFAFAFSCASPNEGSRTAENTGTMGGDEMGTVETEQTSDTGVTYAELFNDVENTENYDILELARMEDDLSTFVNLVEQSGLNVSLATTDQDLTVFIPTNEAFQNLSQERYEYLMDPENRAELVSVIQAHIVPNEISTVRFSDNQRIETSDGKYIPISTTGQGTNITIGGANIVRSDIEAANGIIHVVDAVVQATEDPVGPGAGY